MNSEVFTCFKCDLKSSIPKKQLSGLIFCCRCGAKTDLSRPTLEKVGGGTLSEEGHCRHCNSVIDLNKIESHNDSCDMYPIYCNFCNGKFIRRTMRRHLQECLHSLRQCKFSPIGCPFHGNQLEVEQHESSHCHAELTMKLLLTLQTEQSMLLRSFSELMSLKNAGSSSGQNECCKEMKMCLGSMQESLDQQSKEIQRLERKLTLQAGKLYLLDKEKDQEKEMKVLHLKQSEQMEKTIEVLTKRQTEQCDNMETYQKTLNTVITANNQLTKAVAEDKKILSDKIDALVRKQKEFEQDGAKGNDEMQMELKNKLISNHSPFDYFWKVTEFGHYLDDAKLGKFIDIFSKPFYTSKFGYKMQLNLWGNGAEVKPRLNVGLIMMKGRNDAILRWPVQYTAQLSLLDQLTQTDHYSVTLKSDIIQSKECFDRPTTEQNDVYSYTEFMRLDRINPKHLVDDIVFFKLDLKLNC